MIATRGLKPATFSVGERVLCFEPDPTKVRVLYDSKILKLDWTRDDAGKRVPEYLVHFNGWNHSWDRWAPENFILKYTDENLELQEKLQKEAEEKMRKKRRKRTWAEILEEARENREKMAKESSVSSEEISSNGTSDSDIEDDDDEAVEVPITFPEALRAKLEDDCYFITSKKQLVNLPPDHTALGLMEAYVKDFAYRCRAHNVRVHVRQQGTAGLPGCLAAANATNGDSVVPPPQPQYNVDLCREVMDGVRILFDFLLPTNLLYNCERTQYTGLYPERPLQANGVKEESPGKPKFYGNGGVRASRRLSISPSKEAPPVLEPENLSPTDPPPILKPEAALPGEKEAKEEEEGEEQEPAPARRITRRSSTSNFSQSPPAPAPTRELRSLDGQRRKSADARHSSSAPALAIAAHKRDEPEPGRDRDHHHHHHHHQHHHPPSSHRSLRHSARLASHSSSSTSPTSSPPVITNMESLPALEASTAPASPPRGRRGVDWSSHAHARPVSSRGHRVDVGKIPQTGEFNIKREEDLGLGGVGAGGGGGVAAEEEEGGGLFSIERNCWKLLPEGASYSGAEPPCKVYGAQHLLRLFVKLPEILGGMDLPPKKLKPLVKHVEMFLRWLSATDQLLEYFPDKAYVSAAYARRDRGESKTRRAFTAK